MPTLFEAPQQAKSPQGTYPPKNGDSKMRPLTSFAVNPSGVRFETQEAEEDVILFLRQHFIVNVPWIVIGIVLLFTPTVLLPLVFRSLPIALPGRFMLVIAASWYLATAGFILASFLHWFFNIYIVTKERIIDIDFYYLLFKRFSEAEHEKIQDISYSSSGILATLFGYGNVMIETAGEVPNLEFVSVPRPDKVVETIRGITESLSAAI